MGRRISLFLLSFTMVLATSAAIGLPIRAFADTMFTDCPTLAALQAEVATGGTITLLTANCTLSVTSPLAVGANTSVILNGNGLKLNGGGAGTIAVFTVNPTQSNLTLDHTTIDGGPVGITCSDSSGDCTDTSANTSRVTLTNSTIDGSDSQGIVFIDTVTLTNSTISGSDRDGINALDAVTLTGSSVSGSGSDGIVSNGAVTLTNSTISVSDDDGIFTNGAVTLTDSTISESGRDGINTLGTATLIDSTVSGSGRDGIVANSAVALTGSSVSGSGSDGIVSNSAVTLTGSTVSETSGDGIFTNGAVTLTGSTVSESDDDGINTLDAATLIDSTIRNSGGRGVRADTGVIVFSTIVGNDDGISVAASDLSLSAVILANTGQNCVVTAGTTTDLGANFSTDDTCDLSPSHSHFNVPFTDLHLGTLGDYGGPTHTIPLFSGSVALGAVPAGVVGGQTVCLDASGAAILDPTTDPTQPLLVDQRGVTRPQGTDCDAGAYEAAAMTTTTIANPATVPDTDTPVDLSATVSLPNCPVPTTTCSDSALNQGIVTFSVADAGGQPAGTPVESDTVANGLASATFDTTGLAPGIYTIRVTYHDASGLYADSQDTSTLSITSGLTTRVSLTIINSFGTSIHAFVQTARSGIVLGSFSYFSPSVQFRQTHLTSLVVSGSQATLFGRARLLGGEQVTFRLDATAGWHAGTVRLRLSTGYDSGEQRASTVRITPMFG